ncbi:AzlD domain-containing protein [Conexibacter sp. CPCC 206217]|uniref:AzlD domain-containing protein n=1 Tax=Conexibacter sp. CPCC 206217 TaxID=3064574 RepID=UPI0027192804|nr:AzlD domain-containing protein [Conexibacter sp. CPCC 206217]MDO8212023.1 AzlD domain-containing protein [Conexibacter sp. CPCC 206217]
MSATFLAAAGLALATFAIRAAGPVGLGGRTLPPWLTRTLAGLPAALLAALVVTGTFERGGTIALDARVAGLGVAALATALGARMVTAVLLAAAAVSLVRLA